MEPIDFLKILRQRWKVLALAVVVAAVAAWVTTPARAQVGPPITSYTATATLLQEPGATTPLGFVALLSKGGRIPEVVAEQVGFDGDPQLLASQVSVTANSEFGLLSVTSSGADGDEAAALVNAYSDAIRTVLAQDARDERQQKIQELTARISSAETGITRINKRLATQPDSVPLQAQLAAYTQQVQAAYSELAALYVQSGSDSGLTVYQEATPIPVVSGGGFTPPSSRTGRVALGVGVGLLLGLVLALLVDRVDTRLRRRQDVEAAYGLSVVSEIPKLSRRDRRRHRVVTLTDPVSSAAEAYRSLRSALTLMRSRPLANGTWAKEEEPRGDNGPSPQVVLVTSARAGEGKSTTAANLAVTLAETGKQVLLLDADFRSPSLHALLDVAPGPGLSDLLIGDGDADLAQLARATNVGGVWLVTAGNANDFHGALPNRIAHRVAEARNAADVVVVDAAPLLVGNDSLDFMPFVDSVVVVARSGRITADLAERASGLLARVRVPVLGIALVGAPSASVGGPFGSYSYRSSAPPRHSGRRRARRRASAGQP